MIHQTLVGSPIAEFIKQTKLQVEGGLDGWELKEPIRVELSTIIKGNSQGGIDIQVLNVGTKVEKEEIQKIQLVIGPVDKLALINYQRDLAQAHTERMMAQKNQQDLARHINRQPLL